MKNLFERITNLLDWDERIIFPEQYEEHPEIYATTPEVVYLIMDRSGDETTLDILWANRTRPDMALLDCQVVSIMYYVRVRQPKLERGLTGDLISRKTYEENRDQYVVLDTRLIVRDNEFPRGAKYVTEEEYQRNFRNYELIDVTYMVRLDNKDNYT